MMTSSPLLLAWSAYSLKVAAGSLPGNTYKAHCFTSFQATTRNSAQRKDVP